VVYLIVKRNKEAQMEKLFTLRNGSKEIKNLSYDTAAALARDFYKRDYSISTITKQS
jgi:hypothetical protein